MNTCSATQQTYVLHDQRTTCRREKVMQILTQWKTIPNEIQKQRKTEVY